MTHSWKAYEKAKEITEALLEAGCITKQDVLKVRGIIQIKMEEE